MYPDDTNLTKHITSLDDAKEELIQKVIQWLKASKQSLNIVETKFMLFSSSECLKDKINLIAFHVGDKLIRKSYS